MLAFIWLHLAVLYDLMKRQEMCLPPLFNRITRIEEEIYEI